MQEVWRQGDEADMDEEGEVRIYDKDAFIVSDGELFRFEREDDVEVNWRSIREFEGAHQEHYNLYQSFERQEGGFLQGPADASSLILQNLDAVAACDFEKERKGKQFSQEGHRVLKVMQYAMQYYMFAQRHLTNKVLTLNNFLLTQKAELEKLKQANQVQKHKIRKQKHVSDKLNEQAIHYEILIQRMKPEILEKRMKALHEQGTRKDIRLVDANDERQVRKDILKEQGLLREGQSTSVYDQIAHQDQIDKENQANNQQKQFENMETILGELKSMKEQIAKIQTIRVQTTQQKPIEKPEPKQRSNSNQQKYQSPARDKKQEQEIVPPLPIQSIEESIKSEGNNLLPKQIPDITAQSQNVDSSNKMEESSGSIGGPKMRRVRNPYGSSDLSGSQKSQQSASQSLAKSKRKIEIEKVSDNEGNDGVGEDSYQDDDFEETYLSQKSNEKQRLQQQLQIEKMEKQNQQRQKQINRSGGKLRQSQAKKDATPIKEEDVEDEMSAQEEDSQPVGQNQRGKTVNRNQKNAQRRNTMETTAEGGMNFERDSRQDEIEEDLLRIEEQSRSQTNSVPIEDPSSNSGTYFPSMVEKARNVDNKLGNLGGGVNANSHLIQRKQQAQNKAVNPPAPGNEDSASFADEDLLPTGGLGPKNYGRRGTDPSKNQNLQLPSNKFAIDLRGGGGVKEGKDVGKKINGGVVEEPIEEDDDDEYVDDFEVEEESGLNYPTNPQPASNIKQGAQADDQREKDQTMKTRTDLMDMNISASASLLPPLASTKMDNYSSQQNSNQPNSALISGSSANNFAQKRDLKPENFALNLAESQQSIDFEFSESRTGFGGGVGGFGASGNDLGSGGQLNKSRRMTAGGQSSSKYLQKREREAGEDGALAASGSMDSHDFGLSESNFSMSKRSGAGLGINLEQRQQRFSQQQRQRSATAQEPGKNKGFYAFQAQKFTSHTGDDQSAGLEDDNEFD